MAPGLTVHSRDAYAFQNKFLYCCSRRERERERESERERERERQSERGSERVPESEREHS